MSQKILVTGASGGFGSLITHTLIQKGHTVVGSLRDANGRNAEKANALREAGALVVEIDVTDEASVTAGIEDAQEKTGGLTVVVNNAGAGVLGLQETFTAEDWQRVFDINVFGVQRVNRAVLREMRAQGSGLLVHISSLLGQFVLPFLGPYNASKHALEALAANYRVELSGSGIESVIVQPGAYPTSFHEATLSPSDLDRASTYGDFQHAPQGLMEGFAGAMAEKAPDPQGVADAVAKLVATPRGERPFRTVVDEMGMGPAIEGVNAASEQAMQGIYGALEMSGMLKVS
ncbi:MAG: SDR family oxidoreductase [Planctomycetota bacterium]